MVSRGDAMADTADRCAGVGPPPQRERAATAGDTLYLMSSRIAATARFGSSPGLSGITVRGVPERL